MTGVIKSYTREKKYGFIRGKDSKDYFFHLSNIINNNTGGIKDGALVSFETKATPKGYSAKNITIHSSLNVKYVVPDEVYLSKKSKIKGWDNVCLSDWSVTGASEESPEDAKEDMIRGLEAIDANCGLYLDYYKTTGAEDGTGSGTHLYTIHNFQCYAANIGKLSFDGEFSKEDLSQIDDYATELKEELVKKTKKSKHPTIALWIFLACLEIFITVVTRDFTSFIVYGVILFLIGYYFNVSTDHDSWLEKD